MKADFPSSFLMNFSVYFRFAIPDTLITFITAILHYYTFHLLSCNQYLEQDIQDFNHFVVGYDFGYGHLHSCGFSVIGSEWALTAGHCGVGPSSSFTVGIHAQDEVTDDDKRFVTQVHTSSKLMLQKITLDVFHLSFILLSFMLFLFFG